MNINEMIHSLAAIRRMHGGEIECHVTHADQYSEVENVRFDTTTGVPLAEIQLDALMLPKAARLP